MQIHIAVNPETQDWFAANGLNNPNAVEEFIKTKKLEGYRVASVYIVDSNWRQVKASIENACQNLHTQWLIDQGKAPTKVADKKLSEKSKLPEEEEKVEPQYNLPENVRKLHEEELADKRKQLPKAKEELRLALEDQSGEVNVKALKDVVYILERRIAHLALSLEDQTPRKKKKPVEVAPEELVVEAAGTDNKEVQKLLSPMEALAKEQEGKNISKEPEPTALANSGPREREEAAKNNAELEENDELIAAENQSESMAEPAEEKVVPHRVTDAGQQLNPDGSSGSGSNEVKDLKKEGNTDSFLDNLKKS